ncbi:TniQ family protein [Amycolatopsis sp. w19]|uniref:TniQ family protein n=1 Tax=Amycolatopsis sp. w19 TaxID=3448134 RepID=UPI003F1D9E53
MRPLPRSLDPLPDEPLTGFLLRLAYRLDLTPARLIELTGLGRFPAIHELHLPDDIAATFAHAARLTATEVRQLCLSGWQDRYPPLDLDYRHTDPAIGHRYRANPSLPPGLAGWLFSRSTRYCPLCLADDTPDTGTPVIGRWRKLWRLPPVFACTDHKIMLAHACPGCGTALHDRANRSLSAIPSADRRQHPARCRAHARRTTAPCAAMLTDTPGVAAPPDLLALQQRLLSGLHLRPDDLDGDSDHRPAHEFLYDLRVMTALVRASWPLASHATTSPGKYSLTRHITELERQHTGGRNDAVVHAGLPTQSAICARLLAHAEHLTIALDDTDLITGLLLHAELRPAWFRYLRSAVPACSARLQALLEPRLREHFPPPRPESRTSRRSGITRRPLRHTSFVNTAFGFEARHVPQIFDATVIAPLAGLVGPALAPRQVHRFAATRLVMAAENCSARAASTLLGLPVHAGAHATAQLRHWAERHHRAIELQHALLEIADRLTATGDLIDYQRRRTALQHWPLPETEWNTLVSWQFDENIEHGPTFANLGEHGRLVASIVIWTQTTHGDHRATPLLHTPDRHERARSLAGAASNVNSLVKFRRASARWTHLLPVLLDYSRVLAHSIDVGSDPFVPQSAKW